MHDEIKHWLTETESHAKNASSLVSQCDDALQITTTQGLAAGFDQKAKELQNSIWVWIIGLLVALGFGIGIGSSRVTDFTEALKGDLTAGQGESVNILLNFTQFFETRIEYRFQIFTAHSCDFLLPSYARL
ncbi:hypothetical protein, partial [Aeromonas media]|uniref:hypothetical protein n=1 Tax=Aeromonas media TaxID=651 RepID=UPI001C598121